MPANLQSKESVHITSVFHRILLPDGWYTADGVKITTEFVFDGNVTIKAKWIPNGSGDDGNNLLLYMIAIIAVAEGAALTAIAWILSKKK